MRCVNCTLDLRACRCPRYAEAPQGGWALVDTADNPFRLRGVLTVGLATCEPIVICSPCTRRCALLHLDCESRIVGVDSIMRWVSQSPLLTSREGRVQVYLDGSAGSRGVVMGQRRAPVDRALRRAGACFANFSMQIIDLAMPDYGGMDCQNDVTVEFDAAGLPVFHAGLPADPKLVRVGQSALIADRRVDSEGTLCEANLDALMRRVFTRTLSAWTMEVSNGRSYICSINGGFLPAEFVHEQVTRGITHDLDALCSTLLVDLDAHSLEPTDRTAQRLPTKTVSVSHRPPRASPGSSPSSGGPDATAF